VVNGAIREQRTSTICLAGLT